MAGRKRKLPQTPEKEDRKISMYFRNISKNVVCDECKATELLLCTCASTSARAEVAQILANFNQSSDDSLAEVVENELLRLNIETATTLKSPESQELVAQDYESQITSQVTPAVSPQNTPQVFPLSSSDEDDDDKESITVSTTKNKYDLSDNEYKRCLAALTAKDKHLHFAERGARYLRRGNRKDFLHNGTFLEAVGPVLVIAQVFCLMPVRGIKAKTAKGLSFSWRSLRTWYCLFYTCTTIADTAFTFNMVIKNDPDVRNIQPLIFHFSILLASICFLRLASKWPRLMRNWAQVEKQLPPHASWTQREDLSRKIKRVTFVLLTLSLTEHLLSTITAIHFANYCPARKDPIESYFITVVSQLFTVFEYSTWLAWLGKIQNIMMTFGWTYMDIFVMIMGIGLSSLYKQLHSSIERVKGQSVPESFWIETRLQYRIVCDLIAEVDDAISSITMLSFANNLYFVCIQLLRSINKMPSVAHGVYFYFSLMFLLARTLAVSLFLSEVNDRARDPLLSLKFVPKDAYYEEVARFANEVATDAVALTGLKFFSITRKLVLSVAGTIITYELVLIQFHEDQNLWDCGE